ncbi:MAG: thermonuclease family protein [Gammaproteobacteria bacterium]|nr:thermonuclease family protein [Gammaproteobacteria bacterium]NND38858.1 thermonuclease family protein [Pseudomonadales bacterium]MBT8150798.1 thermonuclease family protein [Gammaproteobacteria bacterium]NNL11457.1 thermonuclease family protein [Pseudomonadales bacterium]NNM11364.1 thermonuclease family protein [Pseudomonadales bacterium]
MRTQAHKAAGAFRAGLLDILRALVAVVVGAAALAILQACGATSSAATELKATCRYVVDGDSLYLEGFKPQIRLWGVDAPERGEAGYQAARSKLQQLALDKPLRCERVDIDKYQRVVARCFIDAQGGIEINRALIDSGVAKEYCWFSKGQYGHCLSVQPR